jgi:LmbE family N-acetylglucosaminyl deacetylase
MPDAASNPFLSRIRGLAAGAGQHPTSKLQHLSFVCAHADDETVSAGAQLAHLDSPLLVIVTDGAPRGHPNREEYARTRRRELSEALRAGDAASAEVVELGFVDQEAGHNLGALAGRLARIFLERRPRVVLAHPYEGGHPDHDAIAFASRAAIERIRSETPSPPALWEFTSYHARDGQMVTCEFLPHPDSEEIRVALTPEMQRRKQAMIDAYVSQREVLRNFPLVHEKFRVAPRYDFTMPPHPGKLFYEHFNWGMTGPRFRELAREALNLLET